MATMRKFRKRPVEVWAAQWWRPGDLDQVGYWRHPPVDPETGEISTKHNAIRMGQLQHCEVPVPFKRAECTHLMDNHGWIDTPEGGHTVCPGDWIIRGIAGEFYPCKPHIFEATYEMVSE